MFLLRTQNQHQLNSAFSPQAFLTAHLLECSCLYTKSPSEQLLLDCSFNALRAVCAGVATPQVNEMAGVLRQRGRSQPT